MSDIRKLRNYNTEIAIWRTIFVLILFLSSLGQITADIYIPSLPAIVTEFHCNHSIVQLTLAVFMLAFSCSQLIYGPVSDRIGRRKPILFGLILNLLASLICIFAVNIYMLMIGRALQGIAVGVCMVLGRCVIRDLFVGPKLAKYISLVGMITTIAIASAPLLGGYFQENLTWRYSFIFLLFFTFVTLLLALLSLPETNKQFNPEATKPQVVLKQYLALLKEKQFLGYTICASVAFSGIVAYLTNATFLLQTKLGLTALQFGSLTYVIAGSVCLAAFINTKLVLRVGIIKMIYIGNRLMIIAGFAMLIPALLGFINIWLILIPLSIFSMGSGFTYSNAFAGATSPFSHAIGVASALYGFLQVLGVAVFTAIISCLHINNQIPLAVIFLIISFLAWAALSGLVENTKDAKPDVADVNATP